MRAQMCCVAAAPGAGGRRHRAIIGPGSPGAPLYAAGDATGTGSDGSAGSRPLLGLRILVAEDEALIALEIEDILIGLGASVVGVAATADDAVALAERFLPDCITMDVRLAGERDGVDAACEIHARFGIRSLFISAYGEMMHRDRALDANPIGWLRKPLRPAELVRMLAPLRG
jgi:CheY-like chemotaxis protein